MLIGQRDVASQRAPATFREPTPLPERGDLADIAVSEASRP